MKRIILTTGGLILFFVSIIAQNTMVLGTVYNEEGEPLAGASVYAKGTEIGTITDMEGSFSLTVPENISTLLVRYLGMEDREVTVAPFIEVKLRPSARALREVLVVAYGTEERAHLTGSVSRLGKEEIERKNQSEFTKMLAGEIPGLQVIQNSGQPGQPGSIRIRGINSVNSRKDPLFVLDGIPYEGNTSAISPSDIESVSVLKDGAAAALYGSRGSNGVIMITTKRGNKGEAFVEADVKFGINTRLIPTYETISSPEQYMELTWEGLRNFYRYGYGTDANTAGYNASEQLFGSMGIDPAYNMWNYTSGYLIDPATGKINASATRKYKPENWEDYIFEERIRTEGNLRISGGDGKNNYYTSFGILKDEGYYIGSDFSRMNVRSNMDYEPKKWLKGNVNLSYAYIDENTPGQTDNQNNGFQYVNYIPSIYPVFERDSDGKRVWDYQTGGAKYDYGYGTGVPGRGYGYGINPAGSVKLDTDNRISHQFAGNAAYHIYFMKDLFLSANFGFQYLSRNTSTMNNPYYGDAEGVGYVYKRQDNYLSYTSNQILNYKKSFEDHNFEVFAAHENNFYEQKYMEGEKSQMYRFNNIEWSNAVIMNSMFSEVLDYSLESYFGQLKYNYKSKYFFHGTLRRDGSSRFTNNKWGNFGSAGFAWALDREEIIRDYKWVDNFKFKLSYGTLGNQFFNGAYYSANYYPTYNQYQIVNQNGKPATILVYTGNPDLSWKKTRIMNTGFEFRFFERLEGEIEFYNKKTVDMLFMEQRPTSTGISHYPVNDGELNNRGFDLSLLFTALKNRNVQLDIKLNAGHYRNKITRMSVDHASGRDKALEIQGLYGWSEGRSLYDFYLREWAGVDTETGLAGWYRYYDLQEDGSKVYINSMQEYTSKNSVRELGRERTEEYDDATLTYTGKSAIPKVYGGFGVDLRWKSLDFSALFTYSLGGYAYDEVYATLMGNHYPGEYNWHKDIEKRWQNPGDVSEFPRLSSGLELYNNAASDKFLVSRSYLNLSNVNLSYALPGKWIEKLELKKLSVSLSADNLFLITARKGFVPMMAEDGGSSRSHYIPITTISGGIKAIF